MSISIISGATLNMSEGEEIEQPVNTSSCCASCGIAEIDDIKLKECDGCDLVKYCSDECREDHKSDHEEECKKRAAELRDELLFKQPESNHLGDCPICSLPMPLDHEKYCMYDCCSKYTCNGCALAKQVREFKMGLQFLCPFCREPSLITEEERDRQRMKRVEANDPVAMLHEGRKQHQKGKYRKALKFYTKAAKLGDVWAHFNLSCLYRDGEGVDKDKEKEIYHLEEAAIAGNPEARHNLAFNEWKNGNNERAVKHLVIAATQGFDRSIKSLMEEFFKKGHVSKDDLAATLRAHKAAVDATKSPQREKAERAKSMSNSIRRQMS